MNIRSILAAAVVAGGTAWGTAAAAPVDLALSLVIDVSGSVSTAEYNLQMDGYANAFRDAAIQTNLLGGASGRAAINVVFFGSNFFVSSLDTFTVLTSVAEINAFADVLDAFVRPGGGGTAIHTGTNRAMDLMLAAVGPAGLLSGTTNLVLDVSGDGTASSINDQAARTRAETNNITINGLPIGSSGITTYYTSNVITADGFVQPASGFDDFAAAVREKLKIETDPGDPHGVPLPGTALLLALGLGLLTANRRRSHAHGRAD